MPQSIIKEHPLRHAQPPEWADAWGHDKIGPWCELTVDQVSQRLRWIPPGQFLIGSPDNEAGRDDDEGPRHAVTITRGFWMFDTPCTQAMWEAVMGSTPSRFKGPILPVETVNWEECHAFSSRLNEMLPGLELRLPTEAEWEYACRGGSGDARYGELDEIAWYSGNSGNKTHDVGSKQVNAWGMYDMLGNVWEWCEDFAYRPYDNEPTVDPHCIDHERAGRVVRGGSWGDGAQGVRAAYRLALLPGNRGAHIGFRCLSSPGQVQQDREVAVSVSVLSRGGARETA